MYPHTNRVNNVKNPHVSIHTGTRNAFVNKTNLTVHAISVWKSNKKKRCRSKAFGDCLNFKGFVTLITKKAYLASFTRMENKKNLWILISESFNVSFLKALSLNFVIYLVDFSWTSCHLSVISPLHNVFPDIWKNSKQIRGKTKNITWTRSFIFLFI